MIEPKYPYSLTVITTMGAVHLFYANLGAVRDAYELILFHLGESERMKGPFELSDDSGTSIVLLTRHSIYSVMLCNQLEIESNAEKIREAAKESVK